MGVLGIKCPWGQDFFVPTTDAQNRESYLQFDPYNHLTVFTMTKIQYRNQNTLIQFKEISMMQQDREKALPSPPNLYALWVAIPHPALWLGGGRPPSGQLKID